MIVFAFLLGVLVGIALQAWEEERIRYPYGKRPAWWPTERGEKR